jgi:hypothetical protein
MSTYHFNSQSQVRSIFFVKIWNSPFFRQDRVGRAGLKNGLKTPFFVQPILLVSSDFRMKRVPANI